MPLAVLTGDKDKQEHKKKARTEHTAHATMLNKETKTSHKDETTNTTPTTPVRVASGINCLRRLGNSLSFIL
jgi:hypothetical protein